MTLIKYTIKTQSNIVMTSKQHFGLTLHKHEKNMSVAHAILTIYNLP